MKKAKIIRLVINAILAENMSVENSNGKLVFKDSSGTILELE